MFLLMRKAQIKVEIRTFWIILGVKASEVHRQRKTKEQRKQNNEEKNNNSSAATPQVFTPRMGERFVVDL